MKSEEDKTMTTALNIRPFTDALRSRYPGAWQRNYDTAAGGGRTVSLVALFVGATPVLPVEAGVPVVARSRFLDVQLSDDGRHRVSHMMVTRDGELCSNPSSPKGPLAPRFMRGTTTPTPFATVAGMLGAIERELSRTDHKE